MRENEEFCALWEVHRAWNRGKGKIPNCMVRLYCVNPIRYPKKLIAQMSSFW
ncbi:hypothetical protein AM1BK_42180 [Neobacillus kokaensis]|uniref:Uncharacterized protein n=1 Tax=Neobacillus kokaensis TaxID=2759023 RepID=A0ABQ3NAJ5_9BACI|nr:hypothetical protein AM1BK_42180 [Neobacillus kokaensis]